MTALAACRRLAPALLPLWLAAVVRGQAAPAEDFVAEASRRLAAVGCTVPAEVRAEARGAAEVIADLDAQQDLFLPPDAYLLQHELLRRLGLPAGRNAEALRQQAIAAMARGLSAYYDPRGRCFVRLESRTLEVTEQLGGSLPLVVHELVHAHQDAREGGLTGFFAAVPRTLDSALARRCTVEGEAEIVAFAALQGEAALAKVEDLAVAGVLDRLFAGEVTGLIYESGRRLALARHQAGGLQAVAALWRSPPPSTEQVLHAAKFGRDVPTAVVVPAVEGLARAASTTIGELMVLHLLRQLGHNRLDASLAAAGWDGDELVVFDRGDEAAVALAWRSVWDREEDAADFVARVEVAGRGRLVRAGRLVDWVAAADAVLQDRIAAACAADRPALEPDDVDAATTAAAEAALRAALDQSRAEGRRWRHDAIGLDVPMPDGWDLRQIQGVDILMRTGGARAGFATNVNVLAQPRGEVVDLEELAALTRQQFGQLGVDIDQLEVQARDGVEVLQLEYHGQIGGSAPLRFLALAYLRGEKQVWITATALQSTWGDQEAELRRLLEDVRITAP
ncbi:MAG: hypothetical protein KF830_12155 [Planctomycetes bacterium]|nr:hypothetical protein [Planctomycetota bacterium]